MSFKQACDYLYQGTKHVGWVMEQKADAKRVENMANAMSEIVDRIKRIHEQLVEHGQLQQQHSVQSLQTSTERCRHDIDKASKFLVESQTDLQARDQRINERGCRCQTEAHLMRECTKNILETWNMLLGTCSRRID